MGVKRQERKINSDRKFEKKKHEKDIFISYIVIKKDIENLSILRFQIFNRRA